MFSRKDIDHGFIEQPLRFGQFSTHAHKPITTIIRELKSRVKGKRETIKDRDAYLDTIVNEHEHESYTK